MKIDPDTGIIEFLPELILRPGMNRREILALDVGWEDWNVVDNVPWAFRAIIKLPNKTISPKTILIVYVGLDDRPLAFWDVTPWDLVNGKQNRPEGKCTRRLRAWFKESVNVSLPIKKKWGHVDASFDPWNQTGGVVCNYRERFNSDEEWSEYKKNNKY